MTTRPARQIVRTTYAPRELEFTEQSDLGGQAEWFWGVPDAMRSFAAPTSPARLPARPVTGDPHAQSLGYWGTLHYLLMRRLGWSRPDRGLEWWYSNGRPTNDPTLALIEQIWNADGGLDVYFGWLISRRPILGLLSSDDSQAATSNSDDLTPKWAQWLRRVRTDNPFEYMDTSGDGLHLTRSVLEHGTPDPLATIARIDNDARRAIFSTSDMSSWYSDLARIGSSLPMMGVQSWKVDVVVKPVGFLGTYRRSAHTGLWFTGAHRFHQHGN